MMRTIDLSFDEFVHKLINQSDSVLGAVLQDIECGFEVVKFQVGFEILWLRD